MPNYPTIPLEPLQSAGVFKEICEKTETRAGGNYPFCERLCDMDFAS